MAVSMNQNNFNRILTLMALLFLFFGAVAAFSQVPQQETDRKFTVQTSPVFFAIDLYTLGISDGSGSDYWFLMDLEGQYKINDIFNVSLTISIAAEKYSAFGTPSLNDVIYELSVFQMNFKPMFVYRPFRTGLKGFYIGFYPAIGWLSLREKDYWYPEDSGDYVWLEISLGINTGYKWVFNNGFTLQLGTGIGKTWSVAPYEHSAYYSLINSDGRLRLKNFDIHIIDFKLGYSF